ncbi:hypothetical protein ACQU0X_14765 [Pseudovibrio ascidiaceicola]|uniref:hypothetical protein n=1 Tax=Pseudovibrio ascidiaceicola TaxID=285279 RepID=UPI003D361B0D
MTQPSKATQAQMKRAIKAAQDCGLTLHECVITSAETRLVFSKVDAKTAKSQTAGPKQWPEHMT